MACTYSNFYNDLACSIMNTAGNKKKEIRLLVHIQAIAHPIIPNRPIASLTKVHLGVYLPKFLEFKYSFNHNFLLPACIFRL